MYSLNPKHFARRRRELMSKMGDDSVAVFVAPPERTRSKDTNYPYRPSSDILYLTGFREPECVVVIAPGHDDGEFVMFVRERDPEKETWDGRRAGPKGAEDDHGADMGYTIGDLDDELPKYLENRETLYYTLGSGQEEFDRKIAGWMNSLRYRRGQPPAAPRAIVDARDVIHEMRLIKKAEELTLMRRAAEISAEAHVAAMEACRPGMHEFELQAIIEHHFRRHGAEAPAYTSIVGAGDNATILHYVENRDEMGEDDIVLIDAGCEYEFYAADITRSFPVSGTFEGAGRDVYQAVLEAQLASIEDVESGRPYHELQENTVRRLTDAMVQLGALSGDVDDLIEEDEYKKYYPHKIGHWLGIDVHDVGSYHDTQGNWRPLEAGMVVTIEPGLYFPEDDEALPEELRGIGVRIEDDILVTPEGRENLTSSCPKSIDELEDIVGRSAQ